MGTGPRAAGDRTRALSSPKPVQSRFYASPDRSGSFFPSKTAKPEGHRATTGLRGRKAYWWPLADDGYWQPSGPPLPDGRQREYLNEGGASPSQVSRHQRWIRPETIFEVTIRVDGLSTGELGALVWLLTLPAGHALRLGGGKPLGFGAVHAELIAPAPPGPVTKRAGLRSGPATLCGRAGRSSGAPTPSLSSACGPGAWPRSRGIPGGQPGH